MTKLLQFLWVPVVAVWVIAVATTNNTNSQTTERGVSTGPVIGPSDGGPSIQPGTRACLTYGGFEASSYSMTKEQLNSLGCVILEGGAYAGVKVIGEVGS